MTPDPTPTPTRGLRHVARRSEPAGSESLSADQPPRGLRDLRRNHHLVPDRPIPLAEATPLPEPGQEQAP